MKNQMKSPDQLSILHTHEDKLLLKTQKTSEELISINPGDGEQKYEHKRISLPRQITSFDEAESLASPVSSNMSADLSEDLEDRNSQELQYAFIPYSTMHCSPRATFLNGRYTVELKHRFQGVVVLDSEYGSEVDYIPDLEITRISISRRKQWIAFSHHGSNIVSIYKYHINGKLKPLFFWEAQEDHVNAIAFLDNGFLATGGGGELYCTDNMISVWNIEKTKYDTESFSKARVPLKYKLEDKGQKYRIEKLLAFPNNQLCSLHGISFSALFNPFKGFWSNTVILWNLTTRKPETISENAAAIHYKNGNLVLDTLLERKEIDIRRLVPGYSLMVPTQEQTIRYFMHGIRSTLEDYYYTSHVLSSGLLKRNVFITLEEIEKDRGRFKQYLKTIKKVLTVLSTATMIVSIVPGIAASLGSVAIMELIKKIKSILDKLNAAKDRIHAEKALELLYENIDKVIEVQHWIQRQYSLSPEDLLKNFRGAFYGNGNLETFIHYSTQYFAWRYKNQVALLDQFDAERLGRATGERIAEPFMMGLSTWRYGWLPESLITRRVSDWLYSVGDLPFLMKRAEPMPLFSTSQGDEVSLPEILAPIGFEVANEKGAIVQIEVEPVDRILTYSLQRHVGKKKETTRPAPDNEFKSYCSAANHEIAQLQDQAKKITEKQKQDSLWSSKGKVKLIAKLGLFSTDSLPFIIKEEKVKKVTSDMKETAHTIEDDLSTKVKKMEAEISALKEEKRQKSPVSRAYSSSAPSTQGNSSILFQRSAPLQTSTDSIVNSSLMLSFEG